MRLVHLRNYILESMLFSLIVQKNSLKHHRMFKFKIRVAPKLEFHNNFIESMTSRAKYFHKTKPESELLYFM
jgi:hypothetical protein